MDGEGDAAGGEGGLGVRTHFISAIISLVNIVMPRQLPRHSSDCIPKYSKISLSYKAKADSTDLEISSSND